MRRRPRGCAFSVLRLSRLRLPGRGSRSGLRHVGLLMAADAECICLSVGLERPPYDVACHDGHHRSLIGLGHPVRRRRIKVLLVVGRRCSHTRSTGTALRSSSRSCWLSHLQYDWQSPVWRHFLDQLGSLATVVRYDERGFGLSDWTVDDFSLPARLADLEAVVDASGVERFALLGMSGGSAVAMAYAIAHPERVNRLVLRDGLLVSPCSSPGRTGRGGDVSEHHSRRLGEGGSRIPARLHDEVHPWGDRGTAALVRRPAADVDLRRERCRQPRRPPAGGYRGRHARISAPTIVLQAIGDRSTTFDNAVTVSSLIPGLASSRSRVATTSSWPMSRRGACSSTRSASFLEPERQATGSRSRPTDRPRRSSRTRRRGPPTRRRRPDE